MSESNLIYNSDFIGRFSEPGVAKVQQSGIRMLQEQQAFFQGLAAPFIGQVEYIHVDRGTVDVRVATELFRNVPLCSHLGQDEDGKIWGEVSFPQNKDYVVVLPLDPKGKKKIVIGTFIPYLVDAWQGQQSPVNSTNKVYTLKLLETGTDPKVYRRIFPSGTSVEVKEDGSVFVETPSGNNIVVDEANKKIVIEQKQSGGVIEVKDANGNSIKTTSTSVTINGASNFEVLQ